MVMGRFNRNLMMQLIVTTSLDKTLSETHSPQMDIPLK